MQRTTYWSIVNFIALLATTALVGRATLAQRSADPSESARIVEMLDIGDGSIVADVGAGNGEWAVRLAKAVGPEGQIFATEVDEDKLDDIRDRVEDNELANVSIVWGNATATGLPPNCCDAILLRRVYHHFTDPGVMNRDLMRALKPGGRLLVIDFDSGGNSYRRPKGIPESRKGHGLSHQALVAEVTEAGLELVETIDDWRGRDYCLVFRLAPVPD